MIHEGCQVCKRMKFLAIPGLMRYFLGKEAEIPYMLKWAIYPFAFMIFLSGCHRK